MKRILLLLFVTVCMLQHSFAQDPHYSQYNETPVYVNPALCGVSYDVRAIANYRSQWGSVGVPYKTYGLSAEFAIKHKKTNKKAYMTTGLIAYQDIAGQNNMSQLHIGGILGVVVNTGRSSKLSFAATGSFDQRRISTGKFQWENQYNGYQYDANIQGENGYTNQVNYADFGAGINYHYSKSEKYISASDGSRVDFGVSIFHINAPLISFYSGGTEAQYFKIMQYGNFCFALPDIQANIIPSYVLSFQGPSTEVIAGLMFRKIIVDASYHSGTVKPMAVSAGAYYRTIDAFIPQVLFEYGKYALGLSYDLNLSKLTPFSNTKGGLEISLRYNWNPGYGRGMGGVTGGAQPTPQF